MHKLKNFLADNPNKSNEIVHDLKLLNLFYCYVGLTYSFVLKHMPVIICDLEVILSSTELPLFQTFVDYFS